MSPPDQEGRGRDSYGTRWYGYRGLYEILESLEKPVQRGLVPPPGFLNDDVQMVFWAPDEMMAQSEPGYLHKVGDWVRGGGHAIVAPKHPFEARGREELRLQRPDDSSKDTTLIKELGLEEVNFTHAPDIDPEARNVSSSEEAEKWRAAFGDVVPRTRPMPSKPLEVLFTGAWAELSEIVGPIEIPLADIQTIDLEKSPEPAARIYYKGEDGAEHTLAALFPLGEGSVTIVSEPSLFTNHALRKSDNAVLAAHLFARQGRRSVFDEFYHGLTVRGNPFWLLTHGGYALIATALAAAAGVFAWRSSLFLGPPLPERKAMRRTVTEYVEAMARLFERARTQKFILNEFASGALWRMRKQLRLAPSHENLNAVATALARTDPTRAEKFRKSMVKLESIAKNPHGLEARTAIESAREVSECF
jgi:hypothetical protein